MPPAIRRRTRARELALQVLYQFDLRGEPCPPEADLDLPAFLGEEQCRDPEVTEFTRRLAEGTLRHRNEVDQRLSAVTRNWDVKRMAVVDRNVLRMAIYELMHCPDIPPKVTINEAIELGKKFSTANSGAFINGILDRVRIELQQESAGEAAAPV